MATTTFDIKYYLGKHAPWRKLDMQPVYVQIFSWNNDVIVNGYYQLDFIQSLLDYFISVGAIEGIEYFVNYLDGVVQIQIMRPWLLSAYYSIHNKFYYSDPLPPPDDTLKPFSMRVASVIVTKIIPIFGSIEIHLNETSALIKTILSISVSSSTVTTSQNISSIKPIQSSKILVL